MMLVMLNSMKLGEKEEEIKTLKERNNLPATMPFFFLLITQAESLADWCDKTISCLLCYPLLQFH